MPLAAATLFLLLGAAYWFSVDIRATRGASITGDEPFYLLTTQSLLGDGDFDLRNQYETRSYESFFDHPDGLWQQSTPLPDGQLLSPHNPGLSALVVPGFTLGGLVGTQIQLLIMAAATMALAFILADRLTGRRPVSWIVALSVGLTATAFIYSSEVYPEFPAALALILSLLAVTRQQALGVADALLLTVSLTGMCWLGVKYAPLALVVSGYFLLRADMSGRIALVSAGAASAGFFAWFHLHLFGALTPYGVNAVYAQWSTADILGGHIEFSERYYRLWGLFIDRRFGIGRWAPLLLVAVPGMALLLAADSKRLLVLLLIFAQMLIATFVALTMMGWWFPGRHPADRPASPCCTYREDGFQVALVGSNHYCRTWTLDHCEHIRPRCCRTGRRGHHRRRPVRHVIPCVSGLGGLFPLYTWWTGRDLVADLLLVGAGLDW